MMFLRGDGIVLKTVQGSDPRILELILCEDILYNLSEKRLYDQNMPEEIHFAIEAEDKIVGEIALKNIRWFSRKGEMSIFIGKEFQGMGYAGKALDMMLEHVFNRLNFHRLEAEVLECNTGSIGLLETRGFTLEGRSRKARYVDGKYIDILRYGLLKEEFSPDHY